MEWFVRSPTRGDDGTKSRSQARGAPDLRGLYGGIPIPGTLVIVSVMGMTAPPVDSYRNGGISAEQRQWEC